MAQSACDGDVTLEHVLSVIRHNSLTRGHVWSCITLTASDICHARPALSAGIRAKLATQRLVITLKYNSKMCICSNSSLKSRNWCWRWRYWMISLLLFWVKCQLA